MPTVVGILTFMSSINFSVSRAEHEKKKFYNLRPRVLFDGHACGYASFYFFITHLVTDWAQLFKTLLA